MKASVAKTLKLVFRISAYPAVIFFLANCVWVVSTGADAFEIKNGKYYKRYKRNRIEVSKQEYHRLKGISESLRLGLNYSAVIFFGSAAILWKMGEIKTRQQEAEEELANSNVVPPVSSDSPSSGSSPWSQSK